MVNQNLKKNSCFDLLQKNGSSRLKNTEVLVPTALLSSTKKSQELYCMISKYIM